LFWGFSLRPRLDQPLDENAGFIQFFTGMFQWSPPEPDPAAT